jgi:hypothetical protein
VTALFIDVSHHDWSRRGKAIDWRAVAAAGLGEVMCARATYGDPAGFNPQSPHFGDFMGAAASAGFVARGGYHNLIRGDQASINRQVDYLRSTLDRSGATWAMADVESYPELVKAGLVPRWQDVQRFHDRWYAVDDRVMAWYIARWKWEQIGSPDLRGLRGPLFNASYGGGDGTAQAIYARYGAGSGPGWVSYGHRVPEVVQFTSTGNVPGASDNTDCNAFRGTTADLVAMLNGTPPATTGDDEMLDKAQNDALSIAWGVAAGMRDGTIDASTKKPIWLVTQVKAMAATLTLIASKIDIDPAELAAIHDAAQQGVADAATAITDAILAKLPADALTRDDVEQAVRDAFAGGLAPDPAA